MRRVPSSRLVAGFFALALALPACAGSASGDKALSGLREELAKVARENEILDRRVNALEARGHEDALDGESAGSSSAGNAANAKDSVVVTAEPQPLKVVKLEPKGSGPLDEGSAEASMKTSMNGSMNGPMTGSMNASTKAPLTTYDDDSDTPRPMLKIGPDGVEESYPDVVPGKKAPKKPVIDPKAAADYDAAYALVKAKKWTKALDAFAGFVVRFPDHPYVANAMYWRGECYASLSQYGAAVDQYEGLLVSHPASAKVPDALLALGVAQRKLGSTEKAKATFARLRKDYPTSEAAKKIPPEDAS